MADIATAVSGQPINEKRAYTSVPPTGNIQYLLIKPAPAECDTIAEIENKYDGRFPETIIVGG